MAEKSIATLLRRSWGRRKAEAKESRTEESFPENQ
jgi:hypothetical protein